MDIVKVVSDRQKAKSLLDTVDVRLDLIKLMQKEDIGKYSSKIVEEYYESLLELMTTVMSIDGYKTREDLAGSHITIIEYIKSAYKEISQKEISLIDDLRKRRIGIKYYGKHVDIGYIQTYESRIKGIIEKITMLVKRKLETNK